jgi:hypothetical protein
VIPFSLPPGESSDLITVVADRPVLIIATNATAGDYGVGEITVVHHAGFFLDWAGYNATSGGATTPPTLTGGFGGGSGGTGAPAGTNMLTFDYEGKVTLQLADADHFVIHNGSANIDAGVLWILEAPTS